MSKYRRGVAPDELEKVVNELIDQLKILVAAVDDLRCEVEWWSRNRGESLLCVASPPPIIPCPPTTPMVPQEPTPAVSASAASCETAPAKLTVIQQLRRLEDSLMNGPIGAWRDPWNGEDAPDLPCGCVIELAEELWGAVL